MDLNKDKIIEIYGFDKKINITIYKIGKFIFLYSSKNELLMVEYNKQCLRYRFFLLFKLVEKLLPSLFNKIYLFDLMNVKLKKSKLLIENLNSISQIKFFEQDIFNIDKKYFHFFDVVRVSNLLNYSYFSENQIKVAINNLKKNFKRKFNYIN